jgi:hypothetical protein
MKKRRAFQKRALDATDDPAGNYAKLLSVLVLGGGFNLGGNGLVAFFRRHFDMKAGFQIV